MKLFFIPFADHQLPHTLYKLEEFWNITRDVKSSMYRFADVTCAVNGFPAEQNPGGRLTCFVPAVPPPAVKMRFVKPQGKGVGDQVGKAAVKHG